MSAIHALVTAVHISVAICGAEQAPAGVLEKAETIAADVYRNIGVAIDWSEGRCGANDAALKVNLIAGDATGAMLSEVTLGFAEPGSSVATVLYDRVVAFSRHFHVKREVLLGYAMAHEIGHLLLPPHSHSYEGVMRSSIDMEVAAARQLRFTKEQGALIVRRIEGPSVAVATH
jgi:hypothetical protein